MAAAAAGVGEPALTQRLDLRYTAGRMGNLLGTVASLALCVALYGQQVSSHQMTGPCASGASTSQPVGQTWGLAQNPLRITWTSSTPTPVQVQADQFHGVMVMGYGAEHFTDWVSVCSCTMHAHPDIFIPILQSGNMLSFEIPLPPTWFPAIAYAQPYYFRLPGSLATPYGTCEPFMGSVGALNIVRLF